jgi:hypothetical protein
LRLEELETRTVPSTLGINGLAAHPQAEVIDPGTFIGTPHGFFPNQIRTAYGFDQIVLTNKNGQPSGIAADGSGQTIAIVDAHDQPNIQSDLAVFDQTFGLPAANLVQLDEFGKALNQKNTPTANQGWGLEISLDVEWIHALAPNAKILLFEANSASVLDVFQAVQSAAATTGVDVVSMSFGISENFLDPNFENFFDPIFTTPSGHAPVSFVAASGDDGGGLFDNFHNFFPAPNYPALVPTVLGVGGTKLTLNPDNTYNSESAWIGSGGGQSFFEAQPSYQNGVQNSGFRQSPDVAFDAQPSTGVPVYDTLGVTVGGNFFNGWLKVGGTSFGAPAWSALLALADQGRQNIGLGSLGNPEADVYQLPSSDFHDITTGNNLANPALPGYDLVTGLGTPVAQNVVHDLITLVEQGVKPGNGQGNSNGNGLNVQSFTTVSLPGSTMVQEMGPSAVAPVAIATSAPVLRIAAPVVVNADLFVPAHVTVTPVVHLATDDDDSQSIATPAAPVTHDEQPAAAAPKMPIIAPEEAAVYDAVFTEEATAPLAPVTTAPVEERVGYFVQRTDPLALMGAAVMVGGTWRMPADDSRQTRRRVWRDQ